MRGTKSWSRFIENSKQLKNNKDFCFFCFDKHRSDRLATSRHFAFFAHSWEQLLTRLADFRHFRKLMELRPEMIPYGNEAIHVWMCRWIWLEFVINTFHCCFWAYREVWIWKNFYFCAWVCSLNKFARRVLVASTGVKKLTDFHFPDSVLSFMEKRFSLFFCDKNFCSSFTARLGFFRWQAWAVGHGEWKCQWTETRKRASIIRQSLPWEA